MERLSFIPKKADISEAVDETDENVPEGNCVAVLKVDLLDVIKTEV